MPALQNDFNALILLSANDEPGVEASLRAVLEPFSLAIVDLQKIALRGRLIIGLLITCDPAHVRAIEADLLAFGESSGFDLAIDYSEEV
ncbi:MAG: ACT domain-containing protein [Actinomycetes bacterium]